MKAPKIAAIDCGTNSFHMIIASPDKRGMLVEIEKVKEIVRLGASANDMKYLSYYAMDRGVETLKRFASLAEAEKAEIRAVATSAVREAGNRKEFIDRVREETGIEIEVVSGAEEGRLIYGGIIRALPVSDVKSLTLDIGGGSAETIIGSQGEIDFVKSVKLGAIRMTKKFFDTDKTTDEQIRRCRDYVRGEWFPTMEKIKQIGFDSVVGTSGTITNIVAQAAAAAGRPVPLITNGMSASGEEILRAIKTILEARTLEERLAIPEMDSSRADIIVGGALILEQAIINLGIKKIILSSFALREGIVFDTAQKMKVLKDSRSGERLRRKTVRNLGVKYGVDLDHAEHVRAMSLKMFEGLKPLHGLGSSEAEILEAAALLHDVGYAISHNRHHKHSLYIIMHSVMPGFTDGEALLIANVARYHRKSKPKTSHPYYDALSPKKRETVKVLGGILRIAEGIDRRRLQTVKDLEVEIQNGEIIIRLIPKKRIDDIEIEIWGAERRKPLAEETFGKKIDFKK